MPPRTKRPSLTVHTGGTPVPEAKESKQKKRKGPSVISPSGPHGSPSAGRHANSYFVGSRMFVLVSVNGFDKVAKDSLFPRTDRWPEGLYIMAGQLDKDDNFVYVESLTEQLNTEFVRTDGIGRRQYRFNITVPVEGSTPSFRLGAAWLHPTLGEIRSPLSYPVEVVIPKTRADSNIVGDSWVNCVDMIRSTEAVAFRNARMQRLVDSLLLNGYTGTTGLWKAQAAAERLGQWEQALSYLEINFKYNDRKALPFASDSMSVTEVRAEYEHVRQRLLAKEPETRRLPIRIVY